MQHWVRFSAKVAAGFLSAWFLLLPVTANALGLGNINMDSALNEPLMARIQLLSANSDDIKGLKVKLASREAFMRAGVDRTQLLSKIKFNIVKKGGKYFVVLTTNQSIREPFLNFLVELNWKNGRMLREYTVLLDPARNAGQQETAQAPETTPPVSRTAAPTPAPVPTSPFAGEEPSQPIAAPAPSAAPTTTTTAKAEQPESPLLPAGPINETSTKTAKQEPPAPAPAPAPTPAPSEAAAPAPAPAAVPEQPFEAKSQDSGELFPAIPLTAYKETGPTGPTATTSKQAAAPEPAMPSTGGELDYGITKKGDNLWDIAEKLKPNNQVTIYQVMMALQKSNPKAFVHGNIHRLKVGQVMRIADPSLLSAMSKAQARKQYQAQTQDWQNYLASRGNKVPRQVINAGEQTQAATSSGVPSGQLTLSTPQSEKMGAGTGSSETESTNSADAALLEQQARKAMQEAKTQRTKNAELMKKLDDLNAELNRMQNLINVKDSDLARLQHKLDELNKQRAASGSQTATASADTQASTAPKPEASTTPPPATTAPAQSAEASAPAEQPAETAQAKPEQPATPAAPLQPAQAEKTAPKPATPAVPSSPAPTTTTQASGGIMGTIKGFFGGVMGGLNAMMLIIGGVIIVVILLLIFILVRRRKGANFQESILTGSSAGDEPMTTDGSPSQGSSLMGSESSFLSDFAISGVSAIQAEDSEVDPLTEADVFMAYGRYEAAEERLQEAINQDPDRGELRVKLLELFNTTKNKQAFESTAEDFYAALGSNAPGNPLWQKVLTMGRELAPDNPLFTGGVAAPSAAAEPAAPAAASDFGDKQDVMDIGLDTGVFNTSDFSTETFNEPAGSQASEAASADEAADSLLDFNLDMDQSSAPTEAESASSESPEDMGLDFSLDMDTTASAPAAEEPAMDFNLDTLPADDTAAGGLDFNLDTGDEASAETPSTHDDLDLSLNLDEGNEPTATDIKLGMEDEDTAAGGLDFDFSESVAEGGNGAGETDMNLGASDASMGLDMSGGGDEVGTKLDLARAYIDMGDPDGARSILDEVLEEGNDGQKQEAQQLMTQIG